MSGERWDLSVSASLFAVEDPKTGLKRNALMTPRQVVTVALLFFEPVDREVSSILYSLGH